MLDRTPAWIAAAAGGELVGLTEPDAPGPRRVEFDAIKSGPGDLFVALGTLGFDPRDLAEIALSRGVWGLFMAHSDTAGMERCERPLVRVENVVSGLRLLAGAYRKLLNAHIVAITGSTGKTSTKDILQAMLAQRWRVHATPGNNNNTVGAAATILEAPQEAEMLVLEIGSGHHGDLTEMTDFARPDLGIIVSIAPAHLRLLGGLSGIAQAKAELIASLPEGSVCVVPAGETLLEPHLRDDLRTVTFGPGGDVSLRSFRDGISEIDAFGTMLSLRTSYEQRHYLRNTLAAVAASVLLGHTPCGRIEPVFSPLRGEVVELPAGVRLINDCYNANPASVAAALEYLAGFPANRRIAVLGGMGELGDESARYHFEIGRLAAKLPIDRLILVGPGTPKIAEGFAASSHWVANAPEAADVLRRSMRAGDVILVKGEHILGLAQIAAELAER